MGILSRILVFTIVFIRGILRVVSGSGVLILRLTTWSVLATTANFHDARFLGVFAILAAVFRLIAGEALAYAVRTLGFLILWHRLLLLS